MPEDYRLFFRRERHTQWVRRSLRTPGILIFGLVMGPCGWVLNLTSTVAPHWRTFNNIPNRPSEYVIELGIWAICESNTAGQQRGCSLLDDGYFKNQVVTVAQGMMVGSLVVTLIGLGVAIPGVRCWRENPNWIVSAIAGVLLFCSGVLTIIPIAWYTHEIGNITSSYNVQGTTIKVGYCIVLGYIGGIFEVLGGIVMTIGICRCCGGRNRGERRLNDEIERQYRREHPHQPQPQPQPKPEPRRVEVPSLSRSRSGGGSSVPYSKDSLDDDVSFPRAKTPGGQSANSTFNGRPYDADL